MARPPSWMGVTFCSVLCVLFVPAAPAEAAFVAWTNWTSAGGTSASGTITTGSSSVSVSYSGEIFFAQVSGGTNYWVPSTPYISAEVQNAPPDSDIIALIGGPGSGVKTITFSQPVVNPVMAILSLGQPGFPVNYSFNAPFDVLSFGPGFWGGPGTLTELPGNVLQGIEGHGTIRFNGTFTSISWNVSPAENWHGFQIGIFDVAPTVVPEPSSLVLVGIGLAGLAGYRRYRRSCRRPA